jgi:hypothetical protein
MALPQIVNCCHDENVRTFTAYVKLPETKIFSHILKIACYFIPRDILELDLTLPQDKVREVTDIAMAHVNAAALELRRLFLVEDFFDSMKFGVLLWCLTYVGSWFNGMTLIIIGTYVLQVCVDR